MHALAYSTLAVPFKHLIYTLGILQMEQLTSDSDGPIRAGQVQYGLFFFRLPYVWYSPLLQLFVDFEQLRMHCSVV
ncbi:unnamed protein product [Camellia sinensis]